VIGAVILAVFEKDADVWHARCKKEIGLSDGMRRTLWSTIEEAMAQKDWAISRIAGKALKRSSDKGFKMPRVRQVEAA
jgi:hypothetical protein